MGKCPQQVDVDSHGHYQNGRMPLVMFPPKLPIFSLCFANIGKKSANLVSFSRR
jgi:hypothetical protein